METLASFTSYIVVFLYFIFVNQFQANVDAFS